MPNSPTILSAPEIIHESESDESTILEKMSQCDSVCSIYLDEYYPPFLFNLLLFVDVRTNWNSGTS